MDLRHSVVHCPKVRELLFTFDKWPQAQRRLEEQFEYLFGCSSRDARSLVRHDLIVDLLMIRGRMKRALVNAGRRNHTRATKPWDEAFYNEVDKFTQKLLQLPRLSHSAVLGPYGRHAVRLLRRGRNIE